MFIYVYHFLDEEAHKSDRRTSAAVFALVFVAVLAAVAVAVYYARRRSGSASDLNKKIFSMEMMSLPYEGCVPKKDGLEVELPDMMKFPRNKLCLYHDKVLGMSMHQDV